MSELGAELEISTTTNGWRLRGELDAHAAPSLVRAMSALPPGAVIVDLADVSFVDSSGLRVLLEATNRLWIGNLRSHHCSTRTTLSSRRFSSRSELRSSGRA